MFGNNNKSRDQTCTLRQRNAFKFYIEGKFHPVLGSQTEKITIIHFFEHSSNPGLKLLEMFEINRRYFKHVT